MRQMLARNGVIPLRGERLGHRQHFISFNSRAARAGALEGGRPRRIYWGLSPNFRLALVFRCFSGTPIPPVAYQDLGRTFGWNESGCLTLPPGFVARS